MKKQVSSFVPLFVFFVLVLPLVSATVIINSPQPQGIYNLGDIIMTSVTVSSSSQTISGSFQMNLLCNGAEINFHKQGISLSAGEQRTVESSLPLIKETINSSLGTCKIKAFIGNDAALTSEFTISDKITITTTLDKTEFNPGENILVKGQAIKENGKAVNGFIELSIVEANTSIASQTGNVNNGAFSVTLALPKNMKAGAYLMNLNAYEIDINNEITNTGFTNRNIRINQVPTSLEIVFEQQQPGIGAEVEPGTNLRVKTVLRDQTGEKILPSQAFITIKNNNDKILQQAEIATDEFLEYPISNNELPKQWKVVALSSKLTAESSFKILEKESIAIAILDRKVIITNTGNVPYNKTALVRINNETFDVPVFLKVSESKEYILTAPDGEYNIEIITENENAAAEGVFLTGKTVDVKEVSSNIISLVQHPFVWIFAIVILGFATFIVFKRGWQRSFIGYITRKKKTNGKSNDAASHLPFSLPLTKGSLVKSKNPAELSLSIKGEKQPAVVIALHVKNLKELQKKESSTEETLQKIVSITEEQKAATYETNDFLFFIFAPARTRTFKNEPTALHTAVKIKDALLRHNKMFKQKIHFGISLSYGEIIARSESKKEARHGGVVLQFMSLGTFISGAKKVSAIAHDEILLTEKANDRLRSEVKTIKQHKSKLGINVFLIKEIRNRENHSKFLRGFLHRLGGSGSGEKERNKK